MKRVLGRRAVAAAIVAVVGITVGGIAYASIPDSNGVIHGCYNTDNGALRVFGKTKDYQQCNATEKALDWNQTGATGATGPATAFFADVGSDGTIAASSPGVTASRVAAGRYQVTFAVPVADCGPVATVGFNANSGDRPVNGGETQADLDGNTPSTVSVQTFGADGTADDSSFHLVVVC